MTELDKSCKYDIADAGFMSRRERRYVPVPPNDVERFSEGESHSSFKAKSRRASRLEFATVIVLNSSFRSAVLGGAGESKFHSKSVAKLEIVIGKN